MKSVFASPYILFTLWACCATCLPSPSQAQATVMGKIVFLDSAAGVGGVSRLDFDGSISTVSTINNFSVGWTNLVYVPPDKIFFYNKSDGSASLGTLDEKGQFSTLADQPPGAFRKNCSHVVFLDDRLVFYEAFSDKQDTVKIGVSPIFTITTLDVGSVPFATTLTAVNDGFLIYYNRNGPAARVCKQARAHEGEKASCTDLGPVSDWTHVTNTNQGIFWYNSDTGAAAMGKLSPSGNHRTIKEFTFRKGYTAVVKSGNEMLFYDKSTGNGETGRFTADGLTYSQKKSFDGDFSTGFDLVIQGDLSP